MEDFIKDKSILEILKLARLDSFHLINEYKDLEELEKDLMNFIKNTVPTIEKNQNWSEEKQSIIYGEFVNDRENFTFLPGQRMTLKKIHKESLKDKAKESTLMRPSKKQKKDIPGKSVEILESELMTTLKNYWTSLKSSSGYEGDEDELNITVKKDGEDHVASLMCILCSTILVIRKIESKPWCTTNFYTHLKKHTNIKINEKEKQKNRRIESFFTLGKDGSKDSNNGYPETDTQTVEQCHESIPSVSGIKPKKVSKVVPGACLRRSFPKCQNTPKPKNNSEKVLEKKGKGGSGVDTRSRADKNQTALRKAAQKDGQVGIIHYLDFKKNVESIVKTNFGKDQDTLIEILLKTREKNKNKAKQGRRYEDNLNKFALYLYLNGGMFTYENLAKNFDSSFPSLSTVKKLLSSTSTMLESELRIDHLYKFITQRHSKLVIWISEDQTKIVEQAVYDSKSNRILGFASKLGTNGFPERNTFLATSAYIIKKHFDNGVRASYVNVVMAQPLTSGTSAFCIAAYGSNNKFNSKDVDNRWKFLENECSKRQIKSLGYSTDEASQCVKNMKEESELGVALDVERPWYKMNKSSAIFTQDTIHILTKMKTRLLKEGLNLCIGEHKVTSKHLSYLIDNVDKTEHLLAPSDLNFRDKMKFKPVQKIMKCSLALAKYCKLSSGTILYISLMNDINECFIKTDIPCRLRIFKIWRTLFIVRAWRVWLLKTKGFTLKNNFITSNTATCIEINAHSLVRIIEELRDSGNEDLFRPWLMGSQACEAMFRAARSCSPNQMTSVNFNIAEFLGRQKRIQLCNDIPVELDGIFQFPRATNISSNENLLDTSLPNNNEIDQTIREALSSALKELGSMGINATQDDCFVCTTNSVHKMTSCSETTEYCAPVMELEETESEELTLIQNNFQYFDIDQDLSVDATEEYKCGSYVKVYNKKSEKIEEIKKTTLCRYLNEDIRKPSADRDRRFVPNTKIRKLENIKVLLENYYAVFYDDQYYIGRAIEGNGQNYTFKFLTKYLNQYFWPNRDDVEEVAVEFVLLKVNLMGNCPFRISSDQEKEIKNLYKLMKSNK